MIRKTKIFFAVLFLAFLFSRIWVLQHPPKYYSDVKHDYERYANMWRYGLTPYREHLYEYPPATIPLLALPLELDQRGVGKFYINYRVQIFLFECVLFAGMLLVFFRETVEKKLKKGSLFWQIVVPLSFYIFAGMLAKDFWYEGLDVLFFGIITLMLLWMRLRKQDSMGSRVIVWGLFWLSVAIKLISLPLALPLFFMTKLKMKKEIMACVIGALVIWGAPLMLYRSSMSVFLVFHNRRPMKYGAFGSYIVEVVNDFTHTEHRIDEGPDFPMAGPVAEKVTAIDKFVFPAAIGSLMLWFSWHVWKYKQKHPKEDASNLAFPMVTIFIFVFFLTTKTFSSPFHLWYVPVLAMYPFASTKQRMFAYIIAILMLLLDTTPFIKVQNVAAVGPVTLPHLRDAFRFIPMFILGGMMVKDLRRVFSHKTKTRT